MRSLIAIALAATLAGCGDRGNQVDFGGDDIGPDIEAIHSQDGSVKMALTQDWVYFALSDSMRAEAQAELDADADAGGLRGFFGGLMQGVLGKALDFRAKYAVAEIRDIRWEAGRLRVEFVDPDQRLDRNLEIGENESVDEAFAEEDVRRLSEAFRTLKEEGGSAQR